MNLLLQWSDELASGDAAIDGQHREFIEVVNRLLGAPDDDVQGRLRELRTHAGAHFGAEDAMMRSGAYPSAGCHLGEHVAVLRSIDEVIAVVAERGRFDIARDLAEHLAEWFPRHADHMDLALVRWSIGQRSGGGSPMTFKRRVIAHA